MPMVTGFVRGVRAVRGILKVLDFGKIDGMERYRTVNLELTQKPGQLGQIRQMQCL